jgi:hypothetical protein
MALTELVDEINSAGWLVSGLYQIDKSYWNASVRKWGHFTSGYGEGTDPVSALTEAWSRRKNPDKDRAPVQDPIRTPPGAKIKRQRI